MDPPSGCVFRTRCQHAMDICAQKKPVWQEIDKDHYVACHLYDEHVEGKDKKEMLVNIR